jgi:hypothetical protein
LASVTGIFNDSETKLSFNNVTVDAPSVSNNPPVFIAKNQRALTHSSMKDGHNFTSEMGVPADQGIGTVAVASRVICLWLVKNDPGHW